MNTITRIVTVLRGRKRREKAEERKENMWTLTGPRSKEKKSDEKRRSN